MPTHRLDTGSRDAESLLSCLRADYRANRGDVKARLVLTTFRIAQELRRSGNGFVRPLAYFMTAVHRALSEMLFSIELRPTTQVGAGLTLFHGFGIVVHDKAVLGRDITLRQNVTIGQALPGGPCPVIEDGVVFGAGASVLGGVTVGAGASIGAHALVTTDVPAGGAARAPRSVVRGSGHSRREHHGEELEGS